MLDGSNFVGRDKTTVYFGWSTVKSADPATFKNDGDGYYSDKNQAYFEQESSIKPLKGQPQDGFQVIGDGFARDNSFGYYFGKVLKGCTSPMTLELVRAEDEPADGFACDAERVFFGGAELKGTNPQTWERVEGGFSMDDRSVYFGSHKLGGATPVNWRRLSHGYSTNGKKVYTLAWSIAGVDLESFEVLPDGSCRDKISAFSGKHRVH